MSAITHIAWCDSTFNPWIGCTKVSPGCAHCYAEAEMDHRWRRVKWGRGNLRVKTSVANWKLPGRWNREQETSGAAHHGAIPPRVFCGSLCDWLDDEVPIAWLTELLQLIDATPHLDWLLLTKRPQNWRRRLEEARDVLSLKPMVVTRWLFSNPPPNVWVGVSAEDQQRWNERVPVLLSIPAARRFVSVEPMLAAIDMSLPAFRGLATEARSCGGREVVGNPTVCRYGLLPDWIIFGGESVGGRPCDLAWIRDGVRQCREAGVKAFVKQLGSNPIMEPGPITYPCEHPKGGDPTEWPQDLLVREFPCPNEAGTRVTRPSD